MDYTKLPLVARASQFANDHHAGQKYGSEPYSEHLLHVAYNARTYLPNNMDLNTVLAVAHLHDVLEDTDATYKDLVQFFGSEIAGLVDNLTDEYGTNRKERKLHTWWKIRSHPVSTFIKLCDRLANMQANGKIDMYVKEFDVFQAALFKPGQFDELWMAIEKIVIDFKPNKQKAKA